MNVTLIQSTRTTATQTQGIPYVYQAELEGLGMAPLKPDASLAEEDRAA